MTLWSCNGNCRWESIVRMTTRFFLCSICASQCNFPATGVKYIDGETLNTNGNLQAARKWNKGN